VHLELGGKAPVVVFDDADIEAAAEGIAVAGYFNAGQDCTAATRVLVAPASTTTSWRRSPSRRRAPAPVGMPDDEDVLYGPVNNANQLAHVSGFIDRAPATPGGRPAAVRSRRPGYFFEPTVVADLRQDDEMIQNEIFGPVITVQRFSDEDEAVAGPTAWSTASPASVWTEGLRPGDAHGQASRLRLRVDQHPHPARRRDAPRRLQEVGLRQGPVDVRARGLHPHQARHGQHRELDGGLRPTP
jgi:betaine-aldehyde dehydrogenase